jgi:hypothetical protein
MLNKTGMEKDGKAFKAGKLLCSAAALMLFCGAPTKAHACEDPFSAQSNMIDLAQYLVNELTNYITQEESLIDEKLTQEATYEMEKRLWEFDTNIRDGLSDLWQNKWLPMMMDQARQLSAIRVDQARNMASLGDAESLNETINMRQKAQVDGFRRYQPNELVCQVDSYMRPNTPCNTTQGCGPSKAQRMATAMTGGYEKEDELHRANFKGTPAAQGGAVDEAQMWKDYIQYWCDPARGDQGCTTATTPTMAGRNVDIGALLWGDKQTIDMSQANERLVVQAVQRYLISPSTPDPVPPAAVATPAGEEALLYRRSQDARYNSVLNVVSQMIAERASGSQIDTSQLRLAAGLPSNVVADAASAPNGASYREVMEALTRDRFYNPEYIVRMVNAPEEVVRENGAINALKMQQMNDIYKRMEEMVFMEASVYANELDHQPPPRAEMAAPVR